MPAPARLIGINHVALEVGDVDAALELYGRLFTFSLRGRAGARRIATSTSTALGRESGSAGVVSDGANHVGLPPDSGGNRTRFANYPGFGPVYALNSG
jgi:catechol 2,3-dioxygenase-like lactoylglutathione lyase family enzyme